MVFNNLFNQNKNSRNFLRKLIELNDLTFLSV
jgi:hypothetical protein